MLCVCFSKSPLPGPLSPPLLRCCRPSIPPPILNFLRKPIFFRSNRLIVFSSRLCPLCNRLERFVVLRSVRCCACLPRSTLPLPSSHLNSVHLQPLRHSPSDSTTSFVHWAVSVPPLASPHQDPRSPCQRIPQPTPPGRQFSPTGTLVPACPRLFPRPRPKQGKVKKKKLVFFSYCLPHYDSSHDSLSRFPSSIFVLITVFTDLPLRVFRKLAVTVTVVFVGA
ncbi:uncharacterized protein BKA55DRAFT_380130 [Fusarium redolens]|jgi:hypothetical protein|uniref:Uncharacterized protein n=1 Tax=Fusarium redolens TaxID=48865 RepID=A0A9P9H1P2_FUSRE|nr:uncharacterized protein BKA55DRAFT_380130 [Fusarium redolens]KAH7248589.1 hypothetical protein BKA55DRAFT_380130 [Fusarium redolens]